MSATLDLDDVAATSPEAKAELARLRAERDELRAMLEKQTEEWYHAVSNDYDHEAPGWAHDLLRSQWEERAALEKAGVEV